MRIKKIIPFGFLLILILIITFLAGLRYGKRVEQLSSQIQPSPTAQSEPEAVSDNNITDTEALSFLLYQHETCEVELLYPDILNVKEASNGARFEGISGQIFAFTCADILEEITDTSNDIIFQGETLSVSTRNENASQYIFQVDHPETKQTLEIHTIPAYLSLIDRTLTYELSE